MNGTLFKSNTSVIKPADYKYLYANLSRYFLTWYLPLVLVAGTLGGIFCLIFLMYSRLFPKTVLIWMVCICVGDLLVLYTDTLRMTIKVLTGFDLRDDNEVVCKTHIFLSNYFFYWSAYMQTCMSIQRLYFITCPLKARIFVKPKKVVFVIVIISILIMFPLLPYLIHWGVDQRGDCEPHERDWYITTSLVDFFIWGAIPLLSMTGSTICISFIILRWSSKSPPTGGAATCIDNVSKSTSAVSSPTSSRMLRPTVSSKPKAVAPSSRHGHDNSGHVTRLLIIINCFYMFSTYPLLIYLIILNFVFENKIGVTIPQTVHKFIYYFLRSLCYLSSSFNWVFYCAAGNIFRQRAWRALRRFFCVANVSQDDSRMDVRNYHYTTSPATAFQTTVSQRALTTRKSDTGCHLYRHSMESSRVHNKAVGSGAWTTPRAQTLQEESLEEEESPPSNTEAVGKDETTPLSDYLVEIDEQLTQEVPDIEEKSEKGLTKKKSALAISFSLAGRLINSKRKRPLSHHCHSREEDEELETCENVAHHRPKSCTT